MKKYILRFGALCLLSVMAAGALLTACSDDDKGSGKIELLSFGPSPALRGGELRFIGKNMDKVEAVVLPNNISISSFTLDTPEEIRIAIPQDAMPGYVVLKTPQGDLTTKTRLGFSEPIVLTSMAPAAAIAGDVITLEGDYLNLIAQVVFSQDVVVDSTDFVSQSRNSIVVKLPKEARTGKVGISNGAEIPIVVYSETELSVTAPSLGAVSPNPVVPGSALTLAGTHLHLVARVVLGGNLTVDEFELSEDHKSITLATPANIKDGVVKLVAYSGIEIVGTEELVTVLPTVAGVAPNPVKNNTVLTISGTHLDLVSQVTFGSLEAEVESQTASQIEVTVPETAVDGTIVLHTLSGKEVETSAITLVKPVLAAIAPLVLVAGSDITLTGTNLDLVKEVKFHDNVVVSVAPASPTSFTVSVPTSAVSGTIDLITLNGTVITSTDALDIASPNVPVILTITPQVKPGALLTITGSKLNLVETVIFQNGVKATSYGSRTAELLEVVVPETAAKGTVTLKLVAFDGTEVMSPLFSINGLDEVQNAEWVFFDFDAGDASIGWNDVGGVTGSGNKYYHVDGDMSGGWAVYFMRNWGKFSTTGITANDVIKLDLNIERVDPDVVLKIRMKGTDDDFWYAWKVGELYPEGTSGWVTATIPLSAFRNDNGNGSGQITNPATLGSEYGVAHGWGAGHITMSIDNMRFETK